MIRLLNKTVLVFLFTVSMTSEVFASAILVPGTSDPGSGEFTSWTAGEMVVVQTEDKSSYFCRAIASTSAETLSFAETIVAGGDPINVQRYNNNTAFSFTADEASSFIIEIDSISFSAGGSADNKVECFETTLYGIFNTVEAANPVNFLEVQNTSAASVDFLATFYSTTGVELGTEMGTVDANGRVDIGLQNNASLQNTFGTVKLSHTGQLGSLKANISRYTFDGVTLNITVTTPLSERSQN